MNRTRRYLGHGGGKHGNCDREAARPTAIWHVDAQTGRLERHWHRAASKNRPATPAAAGRGGDRRRAAARRAPGGPRAARPSGRFAGLFTALLAVLVPALTRAQDAAPAPVEAAAAGTPQVDSHWPALLGAQFTAVEQNQTRLVSPYQGRYSLDPAGDTQPTETYGVYFGWAPAAWAQLCLDIEKFNGAGVSGATGLAGLANGDVIRQGANNLPKRFYIARRYLRLLLPLSSAVAHQEAGQDQVAGSEATMRLELKVGTFAVNDDFDHNRYAGGTRVEFMNWSLWQNTAWDYAADTRGYTDGFMLGYVSPSWSLRYGAFLMPKFANGQPLEQSFRRARGDQLELTVAPGRFGTVLRLLAFRNRARMGDYAETLAIAAAAGTVPDVVANDREGRRKYGYGINLEQPLADDGDTGIFARYGWNDGKTESFAFTEVDRHFSIGGQLAGARWGRANDRLGVGMVVERLSALHQGYLAAGGSDFLLGDGRLNYGYERIVESYYRLDLPWPSGASGWHHDHPAPRVQLSPDFQYVRNPGYNRDRGPVRFWGLRLHVEY